MLSPLLANIALHGMETALGVRYDKAGGTISRRAVVRYADDFAVFCESRTDAEEAVEILRSWLAERGLMLSSEKTRIVHNTQGFDFLGFTIRLHKTPRTRSGYRLSVTPSKEAERAIRARLKAVWHRLAGHPIDVVLAWLNPLIWGWASYVRIGRSGPTFRRLDDWMYRRARHWSQHRHRRKPTGWLTRQYWGALKPSSTSRWVFGDKRTGGYLLRFAWFTLHKHVLVRGTASPDDPRLRTYWAARAARAARRAHTLSPERRTLAKAQDYVCPVCGESLFNEEELQAHHRRPRSQGGHDGPANLALLHLYCHQQIHGTGAVHEPTRSWVRKWLA